MGQLPKCHYDPYSSMKSSKINDINQPVNEENIDKSKLKRYSGGDTYLYIIRPMVFTATEKANIAKNDTINRLKQYEWDGKENYVGLYFGDGEGNSNDYGQTIYLQDKIHVPELYPAPGFKENSVFVEIKEGVTTLWGEIDTDKLPDFIRHTLTRQDKIDCRKRKVPISGNIRKATFLHPLWLITGLCSYKCVLSSTEREEPYIRERWNFQRVADGSA